MPSCMGRMVSMVMLLAAISVSFGLVATAAAAPKKFTLNLGYIWAAPDGFNQTYMVANGMLDYPIVVDKGDDVM